MATLTLEQMKKEYARLKAEKEVRADFMRRDRERKNVASKIRKMKYARAYALGSAIKKDGVTIAKGIAEDIQKAQKKGKVRKSVSKSKKSSTYGFSGNPFGIKAPRF